MRGYLSVVLICISLMTSDRWSFGCALCKKVSTQFLWPFFKLDGLLLLYCESFLYILSIDASSYAQFADFSPIFQVIFQFVNWVFLLHRSLFCFCHLYFCFCQIQKTIVKINAHSFPPPSFLQEFYDIRSYVSIFGPLRVNFWEWDKIQVQLYFSTCVSLVFSARSDEETLLSPLGVLSSPAKYWLRYQLMGGFIMCCLFCAMGLCVEFCSRAILFSFCFVVQFEIRKCDAFFFFLMFALSIWSISRFYTNFRIFKKYPRKYH